MLEIGDQQAQRRENTGAGRDQRGGHAGLGGQAVGVQGAGAAERDQREIARIEAALHRHQPERAHHGGVGDFDNRVRRGDDVEAGRADCVNGSASASDVEHDVAAEEVMRIEPAEDEIGVGHRRFRPATPVAGRSGIGPALRGPTRSRPPESTQAIEPPPAPISTRSTTGVRKG